MFKRVLVSTVLSAVAVVGLVAPASAASRPPAGSAGGVLVPAAHQYRAATVGEFKYLRNVYLRAVEPPYVVRCQVRQDRKAIRCWQPRGGEIDWSASAIFPPRIK